MGVYHVNRGVARGGQFHRLAQDPVVEALVLAIVMEGVDHRDDPSRQGVLHMAHKVQRHRAFAQQVDVQRGEHQPREQRFVLQRFDQHGHGVFFDVNQDFLQRLFDPDHFGGDGHADFAQRPGWFLQPLEMALDVAQAHLLQR